MNVTIIERKAWEYLQSAFTDFIHRSEKLLGSPNPPSEWLDNADVCRLLNISKRTLQTYRDTGILPFAMLRHKAFYKRSDIEMLLGKGCLEDESNL
ncbi:helix-turn-helix domain-containing protein [Porphyromonas levii]|uniref:DNA-binding protein n=1 Tax=Porphyromonas levii TaxID=28114 RepID=A0A4Y8WN67_9PORP|nr:helix-turn-helix domain-containing protein [Porphyromonas levii]MBR8703328.1 hypothetical protein [Porphyromonas levii]MBR8730358.1 hypothetical protein [Porphyromonas levii]MBR8764124.1 hypothetical protein [Porphyromonas levii]MBR8766478.1 hypothetical protein [Porphyromonas levii]MBR8770410.1 hypothetical protein [Porphyromonas levii]